MTIDDASPDNDSPMRQKRRRLFRILLLVVLIGAAIWGLWYFIAKAGRVSTDNAYVGTDTAQITPRISGTVKEVPVGTTQPVKSGDILFTLDDADAKVDVAVAEAQLVQARQHFTQSRSRNTALDAQVQSSEMTINETEAQLGAAQSEFKRAEKSLARREALIGAGAVSGEELSMARSDRDAAKARLETAAARLASASQARTAAQGNLDVNQAMTRGMTDTTDPDIAAAQARLDQARLNMDRTTVRAPISGIVTQKQVQIGQRIPAGAVAMLLVPIESAFVDANFKESQLKNVRVGQAASLTADIYGDDIVYHGRVAGLAGGTGATFALIPAQNASGNWVKVVQRLPVRITLDPAELKRNPLRAGFSMHVEVDTRAK
jgi:membrane fusion protein, multidrug efflux system